MDGLKEVFARPAVEVGIGEWARRVLDRRVGKPGLSGFGRSVRMGEGWRLTGCRGGDTGAVGSGPNRWRMVCINCNIAALSLFMSSNARSRARTRSGLSAGGSSIMSAGDIGAEWKVRLRGERESSEVASAEAGESEGSPKRPMVTVKFERTGSLWRFFPTVRATAADGSGYGNERH